MSARFGTDWVVARTYVRAYTADISCCDRYRFLFLQALSLAKFGLLYMQYSQRDLVLKYRYVLSIVSILALLAWKL